MSKETSGIKDTKKRITLSEANQRIGQIAREVHYSKQPTTITDFGRDIVHIVPAIVEEKQQKSEKK